ncbi:MAG: beta-hydroxyacyl-ACP dehydratase [Nitrospirae bacterium]|nr:beta-hydroxyacyl-ACP dehydratase [Nitrospirota bacterium]MBI5696153.1 beta-hydroxyacyl-ACP dehydratase [Nitrospirota bacterium]
MRFLLIDRITAWEPGVRASATKNVALSEDFFDDHFPLKPIMPGVLIIEGMAQLSGLLMEEGYKKENGGTVKALMSIVERAKFRRPAYPGDTIEYEATVDSMNDSGGRASVKAIIRGELAAECGLIFTFHEFSNPRLERRRAEILSLWINGVMPDEAV